MTWKGLFGGASKTFSNIDFDIAKSALQKYIRRGIVDKAVLAAVELYRLGEVGGTAGVTNMYNRLCIIANEDIGPANLPLVLEVTRLVQLGDRDIYRLVNMVKLLAESFKTRLMSHAWWVYANPNGRTIAKDLGLVIDTEFSLDDIKYVEENKNSILFITSDPEDIRAYVLVFLKRLYEKNFNAFTWAAYFMDATTNMTLAKRKKFIKGGVRCITGKADILLWKALSQVIAAETHDILVEAYYNHTENRPFLQHAILIALYDVPYAKMEVEAIKDYPNLQGILNGEVILEVDAFVIDKHTSKGRSLGMGIQQFVEEGALVSPQDTLYYNKELEDIYMKRI